MGMRALCLLLLLPAWKQMTCPCVTIWDTWYHKTKKKKVCVWTRYLMELKLCGVHEKAQAREALCMLWVFPSVPPLCIKAAKISCTKAVGDHDMHRGKLLPLERQQIHFRAFTGWLACWCSCNYRYFLSVLTVNVPGLELPANKPGVPGTKYDSQGSCSVSKWEFCLQPGHHRQ